MLRIRIEELKNGFVQAIAQSEIHIENDGSGTDEIGHYIVRWGLGPAPTVWGNKQWAIRNFPRQTGSREHLAFFALASILSYQTVDLEDLEAFKNDYCS